MEILNFLSFGHWSIYLTPGSSDGIWALTIILSVFVFMKFLRLWVIGDSDKLSGFALFLMVPIRLILLFITYFGPLMLASLVNSLTFFHVVIGLEIAYLVCTFIYIVSDEFDQKYYFEFNKWVMKQMRNFSETMENSGKLENKINKINSEINEYRKNSLIG